METITITLPDEQISKVREKASRFSVSPEELVQAGVEELLIRPDEAVETAMQYVLKKNVELYRRLA